MSRELLASKVAVVEEDPQLRTITAVPSAVAGIVGITARGPIITPVLTTSWEGYRKTFGGFSANSEAALFAHTFFQNGGSQLWVSRTTHFTDIDDANTKTSVAASAFLTTGGAATAGSITSTLSEPYNLASGDHLDIDVNGAGPVIPVATFTAASPTVTSVVVGFPTGFVGGEVLNVTVDSVPLVITFTPAAQTAADVANEINGQFPGGSAVVTGGQIVLSPDGAGNAVTIQVTGGTANAVLAFPTGLATGTGNVGRIDGVTGAEIKTIVELAVAGVTVTVVGGLVKITSNTLGATSSVQVMPASTADSKIGFDNSVHSGTAAGPGNTARLDAKWDGDYGNNVSSDVIDATSGDAGEFNFVVYESGSVVEVFPNLSMDPTASNYVESIVNAANTGSDLLTFVDLLAGTPPANRPTNQSATLTGGSDGLTGLVDTDFIGSQAGGTGLRALDLVQDLRTVAVPGRATSAVHNAMVTYCEDTREGSCFAVLDPPAGLDASAMVTYFESTASLLGLSEFFATYWPRTKIVNPSRTVFGDTDTLTVYPSGQIAGLYARVDAAKPGGVYEPPAGIEKWGRLIGVVGLETNEVLDEKKRDVVFPKRINPITTFTGAPHFVDGARTGKANGNFPYVSERRGVIFIEQSIKAGIQFARHRNNDEDLREEVRKTIKGFLITQMNQGAFRTKNPDTAFFVDVSESLNPPSEVFAGRLNVRIGLATQKPAEWIIIRISQDTRALEEELAG